MAKLYFYYSAMNAGKSTTLLQAAFNYEERGMQTMRFASVLDDRYGVGIIASRIGLRAEAHVFDPDTHLFESVELETDSRPVHCVFVDEAQFLTKGQVFQLARVCDELDIPVIAYGIRTDFQAELFEGSKHLLAIGDVLQELKTICPCGAKATMNMRIDAQGKAVHDGAQHEIGGEDRYIALCRKHYFERLNGGPSALST